MEPMIILPFKEFESKKKEYEEKIGNLTYENKKLRDILYMMASKYPHLFSKEELLKND